MMDETMVGRVARAIAPTAFGTIYSNESEAVRSQVLGEQRDAMRAAKRAIRAMREPTVDMEVAGTEHWLCEAAMEERSGSNWRAMIDAALAKGDER